MSTNTPSNAIERIIEKMDTLWAEFIVDKEASTAIWCVSKEEYPLVQGFVVVD